MMPKAFACSLIVALALLVPAPGRAGNRRSPGLNASSISPQSQTGKGVPTMNPAPEGSNSQTESPLAEPKSLFEGGKLPEAETATRQFLTAHPNSAEAHFLLGQILFQELHAGYAAEEKADDEVPARPVAENEEQVKLRHAKANESLAEFAAGAKYGTPGAGELKTAAFDYVLLRDNLSAIKYLNLALKLQPRDAQGWFYLGRVLYSQDEFANAIEAFENCLKLEPKNAVAEYNVGLSYEGLKHNEEAIQAYQTAITWQEEGGVKSSKAFTSLARIYLDESQPEKALPYLQQAVAAFPQLPMIHEQLGKTHLALNQLPQAQEELEKAVSMEPGIATIHLMLGQVYRKLGMLDKAKSEFQKAQELYGTRSSDKPGI